MAGMTDRQGMKRIAAALAVTVGLVGGGYGIATAANAGGTGTAATGTTAAATTPAPDHDGRGGPGGHGGCGGQRSDETALTGDAAAKVKAAAVGKLPGATVERVETDADGNARYEAHVTTSDGAPAMVYVAADYSVVSVETR